MRIAECGMENTVSVIAPVSGQNRHYKADRKFRNPPDNFPLLIFQSAAKLAA
jgi:hypothetical protein